MGDSKIVHKWIKAITGKRRWNSLHLDRNFHVVEVKFGFVRFHYVVSDYTSDKDGNWHVGSIATLVDIAGAAAIHSCVVLGDAPPRKVTVDFNISYFSTAKTQEEVVIESQIVGDNREKLTCVVIEIKRKDNGALIALGKQWMASREIDSSIQATSKL